MEDLRLGRLLLQLQLVKEKDLEEALKLSEETRLPLGKVLVMIERLSDTTLKTVVEAQWMLRDKVVTMEEAAAAIDIAKRNNWSLSDAMVVMGSPAYISKGTRLGELISASKIMEGNQLSETLQTATASGLPLGRVLMLLDTLPEELIEAALRLQQAMRSGQMDAEEAAAELAKIKADLPSIEGGSKLGELLMRAGLLQESEVQAAVGMANANGKLIGEVLQEFDWVSLDTVEAAVVLQGKIRANEICINDAVKVIKRVHKNKYPLETALGDCGLVQSDAERKLTLYEFLRLTGYMTGAKLQTLIKSIVDSSKLSQQVLTLVANNSKEQTTNIKQAIKLAVEDSNLLVELLLLTEPANRKIIEYAHGLQKKVQAGTLKLEKALLSFARFSVHGTNGNGAGNGNGNGHNESKVSARKVSTV